MGNDQIPPMPKYEVNRDRIAATPQAPMRVTVVDFDMSFGHLVMLFVKAAIAAIPAAIVLVMLGVILVAVLGGLVGLGHR
jgi:hypothetical protein